MLRLGWPRTLKMPRSPTPWTCPISDIARAATFSRMPRSGPMILTELAPLTPESPSSTLSWMYCEKLKTTPGNSRVSSPCSSFTSCSLVRPGGHSSRGLSGANSSTLLKPEASLPSSGRPCCDTTVNTSGKPWMILRIRLAIWVPASSEMVGGMDARIHRLPSSSAGRNSLPSWLVSTTMPIKKAAAKPHIQRTWARDQRSTGS
mmetsp:Transcript_5519/g.13316  ORF Transcript_5519/g.13316 Transcript_5519/m.13316 type:complete len:204 (-) Transcript_5519:6144-6755(-)